jgi:hypothetical protein
MKKILLVLAKLTLAIFFLYNIGLFSLIGSIEESIPPPIKEERERLLDHQYLIEKMEKARAMGSQYGPEEYFSDLTDIRLKEKANDFDRSVVVRINTTINEMQKVFSVNERASRKISRESENDFFARIDSARNLFYQQVEPELLEATKKSEEISGWMFLLEVLRSIWHWFIGFYLKNLPLAIILLWLWLYQKTKSLRINNPVSFFICILLYPIVIIQTWRKMLDYNARIFFMSIELKSRGKDLFSLISENELIEIKSFARDKIKLSQYRAHLEDGGLQKQHSLFIVILPTFLILMAASANCFGNDSHYDFKEHMERELIENINAPPDVLFEISEEDPEGDNTDSFPLCLSEVFLIKIYFLFKKVFRFYLKEPFKGHLQRLKPIPLSINVFSNQLFKKKTLIKNQKNEKGISFNNHDYYYELEFFSSGLQFRNKFFDGYSFCDSYAEDRSILWQSVF